MQSVNTKYRSPKKNQETNRTMLKDSLATVTFPLKGRHQGLKHTAHPYHCKEVTHWTNRTAGIGPQAVTTKQQKSNNNGFSFKTRFNLILWWAEAGMHVLDFLHVVFVFGCCNHSEAFKMTMGQSVSLFSLDSVHGRKCWLTSVCAHEERHHFLCKWFHTCKFGPAEIIFLKKY